MEGRLLLWLAAALLSSCQVRADESRRPAAATWLDSPDAPARRPAAAPVPDSLALTPVPALPNVPDTLRQAIRRLHAALG